MIRLWASAVVCSRSMASVANATAVSKPKQLVVPTMSLSIVLGTPTIGMPRELNSMGDGERAVAADHDERAEAHLVEHLDDAVGVVARAVRGFDRVRERIAAVDRAENRAAEPQDAGDVARREHARPAGLDQAVEAVFEADALDAAVGAGLDHRTDDRVEAGCVAAAGEDADACDCGCQSCPQGVDRRADRAVRYSTKQNAHATLRVRHSRKVGG